MKDRLKTHKTLLGILILGITALILPIILLVARDITNLGTQAALPGSLEAEAGSITTGANVQNDSNASGGQYILFNNQLL